MNPLDQNSTPPPQQDPAPEQAPSVEPPQIPSKQSHTTSTSQPTKQKNVLALVAIVVAIIGLAVAAYVVYAIFFSVSKEDYQDAYTTSGETLSDLSKVRIQTSTLSYISGYRTDIEIKNDADSLSKSLDTYKETVEKLAKEPAVNKDATAQRLYEEYEEKQAEYQDLAKELIASKDTQLAILDCKSLREASYTDLALLKSSLAACKSALDRVDKTGGNKHIRTLVEGYKTYISESDKYISSLQALNRSSSDYFSKAIALDEAYYKAVGTLSDVEQSVSSSIEKQYDEAYPEKALKALDEYLQKKSR